jgi:hypothetical protein
MQAVVVILARQSGFDRCQKCDFLRLYYNYRSKTKAQNSASVTLLAARHTQQSDQTAPAWGF